MATATLLPSAAISPLLACSRRRPRPGAVAEKTGNEGAALLLGRIAVMMAAGAPGEAAGVPWQEEIVSAGRKAGRTTGSVGKEEEEDKEEDKEEEGEGVAATRWLCQGGHTIRMTIVIIMNSSSSSISSYTPGHSSTVNSSSSSSSNITILVISSSSSRSSSS